MKFSQKTRYWLAMMLAIILSAPTYAQNITVTGTVLDETGEPLIGATIVQKGTSNGTAADLDGNYSISVPAKSTLVISYVGYNSKDVPVNGRTKIDVKLDSSSTMLDEVVAIGYGTVKKKDLTGAVSSVSGAELAKAPVVSAAQALQGKAAGINIVQQSGAPGAGVNVTIRGGTSLTQSTSPLYIVDGFPMDNALSNIDINDIETIDVLKDASSTAIYGARGSNGIVVITTKSAASGKTKVEYNGFVSFDVLSKKLDVMDNALEYVQYQYELATLANAPNRWTQVYDNAADATLGNYMANVYSRMQQLYGDSYALDMQQEGFGGSSLTQNHSVSLSGGSEKVKYLVSYNYTGNDGLLANHDYKRSTVRAKINAELYKGVKFDFSTFFYNAETHGGGKFDGMDNLLQYPINGGTYYTRDQLLNSQTLIGFRDVTTAYAAPNQLVQNLAATSEKRDRRLELNAGITIDLPKNFTWRTSGNYVTKWGKSTSFADENSTGYLSDPTGTGVSGSIGNSESYNWHIANTLTYANTFNEKHDLTIMLGQEYSYSESESNSMSIAKLPVPNHGLDVINNAEVTAQSAGHSHNNLLSFFGRASYTYDGRYILTATMRADGSSKFAKGNKWGFFPSVSGAWRISQEKFFEESNIVNVISNLKLRAGYGVTGNNSISDNLYTTAVSMSVYPMGNDPQSPAMSLGSELGNKDLKWETLHATNIGIDLGMFNGRINLGVDWYNNQISDMLMSSTIPSTTGYTKQMQNVGKMRNRGWEIALNTVNISTRNFQWSSVLNLSFNRSKVIALNNGLTKKEFSAGSNRGGQVTYYASVGDGLGAMYGYKYIGIYTTDDFIDNGDGTFTLKEGVVGKEGATPQPGDIKFAANNEDGTMFVDKAENRVKIGDGTPKMYGGFGNTFSFKGFDLNIFMKFSVGNDVYNATRQSLSPFASIQNTLNEFGQNYYRLIDPLTGERATTLARLKELNPNENSRTWSLTTDNANLITKGFSYYVEDGSYLRISQVTLGYTFPDKWMRKAHISKCRLYFTANNLANFTKYKGYDPDASSNNPDAVATTPGFDSKVYPLSRSFVVGLNLSF
ncbi:MAG: TonB-dependent receptor [Muribaculaceae bacterium]|nr:TonB-dependent receptor [Muribaculaceae bacterium]